MSDHSVSNLLQDTGASQQNGGNLVFSTTGTSAGATVTDRLTIDSSGLATFGSSLMLASSSSTLTSSGNTVLGSGSSNLLTVNAAATFMAAVTYGNALTVAGLLTASGNIVLGSSGSNTLTVAAAPTFSALATFTSAVAAGSTVTVTGTLTANGNAVVGTSSSNTLQVASTSSFGSAVSVAGTFTASSNSVLGTSASNTLTVNAVSTLNAAATVVGTWTAQGNSVLGTSGSSTLVVNAVSTFNTLATFNAGVAITRPVTVNGQSLQTVALTASYSDLITKPTYYFASSSYSTAASGAPVAIVNVNYWYGTVAVSGNSGVATIYPTVDGTSSGTALFTNVLSVLCNSYIPNLNSATSVASVSVTGIATNRKSITVVATAGSVVILGGTSQTYASSGTLLMCTVVGQYS